MSPDVPSVPPEAEVIRLARMTARLTPAEAAAKVRAAGGKISDAYWRDTERGRGGRRGQPVPSRASDEKLAQMAHAVGVTPERLRAAARSHPEGEARARVVESAARVLGEMQRRDAAAAADTIEVARREDFPPPPPRPERPLRPDFSFGHPEDVPYVQAILRRAYDEMGFLAHLPPGPLPYPDELPESLAADARMSAIPGRVLFPGDTHDAGTWDNPDFTARQRLDLVAYGHRLLANKDERERRTGTG